MSFTDALALADVLGREAADSTGAVRSVLLALQRDALTAALDALQRED